MGPMEVVVKGAGAKKSNKIFGVRASPLAYGFIAQSGPYLRTHNAYVRTIRRSHQAIRRYYVTGQGRLMTTAFVNWKRAMVFLLLALWSIALTGKGSTWVTTDRAFYGPTTISL